MRMRRTAQPGAALSGAAPSGAVPSGAAASGAVPSGAVPSGAAASGAAPSGAVPSGAAASGAAASGRARRRTALLGAVLVGALAGMVALSGCSFSGLYGVPLPGGPDIGAHPYRVQAQFTNVLDLVPQSAVRVNDVPVGKVVKIELDGWVARVTMAVNGDVRLPANARAELRQTSLLGEKFVSLQPPTAEPPEGTLTEGALIPLAHTNRNPEVEEVLAALSALLTGGGIEQLRTIARELNGAMTGRETDLRSLLANLNSFVGTLDVQRVHITRALDSLDRLSATLAANHAIIGATLSTMPAALRVLADQRRQLVAMLTSLSKLGATGTRVINASRDDVLADLARLGPTVRKLADAGDALPQSIGFLLTFPFPDSAVQGIRGDYANAFITLDADVLELLSNVKTTKSGPGLPQAPRLPGLPAVPLLPTLPQLPTLPGVPGVTGGLPELPGAPGGTTGGTPVPTPTPTLPVPILPGVGGGP